jgi:hypothetical protein
MPKCTIRYYSNYWDGPLDGVVRLEDGTEMWFHMISETEDVQRNRTFALYAIESADAVMLEERHAFWNECSGNGSFDLPLDHKPTRILTEFYDRYPPDGYDAAHSRIIARPVVYTITEADLIHPIRTPVRGVVDG